MDNGDGSGNSEAPVKAPVRDDILSSGDASHYVVASTFGDGRHITAVVPGDEAGAYLDAMRRTGAVPVVFALDAIVEFLESRASRDVVVESEPVDGSEV